MSRRVERDVVEFIEHECVDCGPTRSFVNRLSDFLFTAARYVAILQGNPPLLVKMKK